MKGFNNLNLIKKNFSIKFRYEGFKKVNNFISKIEKKNFHKISNAELLNTKERVMIY